MFLKFPEKLLDDFVNLSQHDYVTCSARLLGYKGRIVFQAEEVISIEPFDPTADFLELNQKVDELQKVRIVLPGGESGFDMELKSIF